MENKNININKNSDLKEKKETEDVNLLTNKINTVLEFKNNDKQYSR